MAGAVFRDPVALEAEHAALQLEIARALVSAPALPIEVPAFHLTLLSVAADKRGIDLVLGKTSPIAKLRIERAAAAGAPPAEGARVPVVDVHLVPVHSDTARFEPELRRMAVRLRAAISGDKWERARAAANRLIRLPIGVPLAF